MASSVEDRVMRDLDYVLEDSEVRTWEASQIVRASMRRLANDTTRTDCAMWAAFARLYDEKFPE